MQTPMKIRNILTFAACVSLIGSPLAKTFAADLPTPTAKASPKPLNPDQEKWNAARKKAMEDPDVKAAMDAANKEQLDAHKKMLEKIREIDPSLGPEVDKEEARMKPREPKPPKAKPTPKAKPSPKAAAKTPAANTSPTPAAQ